MENQTAFFLRYLPIKVSLVSRGTASLPSYLGSTLRGVIGQALHKDIDAYNYLYNNRILSGNRQDIVNPYVIIPPASREAVYSEGDELSFYMLLLGDAVQYVIPLMDALQGIQRLGLGASRYPFELTKVTHSLDQRMIWQEGVFYGGAVLSTELPCRRLTDVKQLVVRTCTPLRIRRNGALLETVDFPTLIRNITHRFEAIAKRYGGWVDSGEIEQIQMLAADVSVVRERLEVKNLARYSNRLEAKMDFSGLMGDILFEGDLTPFVPWLYAAQILHVGRNTTFGMGRIEVEFI